MREDPPQQLVEKLDRLGLATRWDFGRVRSRVRRLAREIPLFESVWIDALQQAGVLSPLQAAELNAGRGEALAAGPFVLAQRVESHGFAHSYRGREIAGRLAARITVTEVAELDDEQRRKLDRLVQRLDAGNRTRLSSGVHSHAPNSGESGYEVPGIARIERWGHEQGRLWTASRWFAGRSARDWLIRHGRFAPDQVLEIARQMVRALAGLEQVGVLHTDISATRLLVSAEGAAILTEPGLREIVRPEEGYAHADLLPEAYDYLAPERVAESRPASTASDLYACGALWWHLLTGRPPLGGGNSLTKLRAAQRAKIADVRRLTVEVPAELTAAIQTCLARQPAARPASFAALAESLGTPSPSRRQSLARAVRKRPTSPRLHSTETPRAASPARLWAAAATALLILAGATRPWWPMVTDSLMGGSAQAKSSAPVARAVERAELAPAKGTPRETAEKASPAIPTKMPVLRRPEKPLAKKPETTGDAPAAPLGPPPWKIAADGALVLSSKAPIDAGRLGRDLRAGMTVRGAPSAERRPRIEISDAGLAVNVEGVTFEGLDFVWQGTSIPQLEKERPAGMIRLAAHKMTLRGCSFTRASEAGPVPAVLWTGPRAAAGDVSLPTGHLSLARCYVRGIGAVVESQLHAALVVECHETLVVESGPLVRVGHWPAADEPLALSLSKSTLRQGAGLLECRFESVPEQPGRIALETRDGVFAPAARQPLVALVGATNPAKLLAQLEWTGDGSVVAPEVPVAAWRDDAGRVHPAREDQVRVENLLRGGLGFAGPIEDGPAASRVVRWQAPRRSPDAPGIGDEPLFGP